MIELVAQLVNRSNPFRLKTRKTATHGVQLRVTLDEWRKLEGYSFARLGALIGVSEETARRYCLPETDAHARFPDRCTLRVIYQKTEGKVTPNDFVGVGPSATPAPDGE